MTFFLFRKYWWAITVSRSKYAPTQITKHCYLRTQISAFSEYSPPSKIEKLFASTKGNKFAGLNSAVAGPRFEEELPRGLNSFQLYSCATPNGQKVGIMLEELGISYDAHGTICYYHYQL